MVTKLNNMERPLKLWEFIIGIVGVLLVVATMIYNRGTMDAKNEAAIGTLQIQVAEIKVNYKDQNEALSKKIDNADSKLNDILIILQNKQDRK